MKSFIAFFVMCVCCSTLFAQNDTVVQIDNPIRTPIFKCRTVYVQRNDTVFVLNVFPASGKQIDSICYSKEFFTKLTKKKWISYYANNIYTIAKYRKVKRPSEWFRENNEKWFPADFECVLTHAWVYDAEGLKYKFWRFGTMSKSKQVRKK